MAKVKPVVAAVAIDYLVEALIALIYAREKGTARELDVVRNEAQRLLEVAGYAYVLPKY